MSNPDNFSIATISSASNRLFVVPILINVARAEMSIISKIKILQLIHQTWHMTFRFNLNHIRTDIVVQRQISVSGSVVNSVDG